MSTWSCCRAPNSRTLDSFRINSSSLARLESTDASAISTTVNMCWCCCILSANLEFALKDQFTYVCSCIWQFVEHFFSPIKYNACRYQAKTFSPCVAFGLQCYETACSGQTSRPSSTPTKHVISINSTIHIKNVVIAVGSTCLDALGFKPSKLRCLPSCYKAVRKERPRSTREGGGREERAALKWNHTSGSWEMSCLAWCLMAKPARPRQVQDPALCYPTNNVLSHAMSIWKITSVNNKTQ